MPVHCHGEVVAVPLQGGLIPARRECHIAGMQKDRYLAWYAPPEGAHSPLGPISAASDEEAELLLSKMVRRRSAELDVDGFVSLTNAAGEDVGAPSRVGEHLIQR